MTAPNVIADVETYLAIAAARGVDRHTALRRLWFHNPRLYGQYQQATAKEQPKQPEPGKPEKQPEPAKPEKQPEPKRVSRAPFFERPWSAYYHTIFC